MKRCVFTHGVIAGAIRRNDRKHHKIEERVVVPR
jgi:hypothetical protein